uniref:Exportin-2 n=1 Tax=Caenorhabditis tropicalis TaxID=1561998 RepID=A0A1I7U5Y5_9PELO
MEQIGVALQETLEPNSAIRKRGEEKLRTLQSTPGFIIQILQLVVNEHQQIAPQIRMAAAIALKNFVKRNWGPAPEVEMSQEEEEQFRSLLLEAMFNTKSNVQEILSNALYLIAQRDFPEKWPELVPYLSKFLTGSDLNHLVASLTSMEQIFRKFRYESKSTELWKELLKCLLSTQEPLTLLLRNMMEVCQGKDSLGADEMAQWLKVLNLIAKVYHSLCAQEIPEYFEDHLNDWMPHFLRLIQIDVPSQTSASGEPTTLDELKHEICEIFTLYSQRYEEEIAPYVPDIISSIWRLLETTGPETRYDTMVCAALEFLSMVSQRKFYEAHFSGENVLKTLAENVCVQNLLLRQQDMELFEDEPLDYMKRDIEGTDVGTRRRGAIDLARGLCRRFEDKMVPCLDGIIQNLVKSGDWIKIDIVYSLVTAIAVKTETAKNGVTATNPLININDFFINQVATHLNSDVNQLPILKVDALKFAVTFRKQLAPEHLMTAIKASDALLSSNSPILHKYAAYAIERILISDTNKVFSAHNLPVATILQNLVAAFDKDPNAQNSPYLIKAILRIIVILDDETIRHADAIATKLAQLIESATKNPADSVHTHFLFETICVLVTKTRTIGASLDAQLLPLIEVIFREDLEDLIPYALQITGVLVSSCIARNASIDQFSAFLPFLLSERLWARSANVPAALSVLEVLLSVNAQRVITENSNLILSHLSRLLGSKSLDQYGFQLAAAVLPSMEHFEGQGMTFLLNTMFRRVQSSKTPKFIKLFIVFLCRFTILRSAEDLVRSCENIQTGMFAMLIERIVCIELPALKQTTTAPEKRIIAIGMANLLSEATQQLAGQFGILSYETAMLLEATSASDRAVLSPEDEQASMYNAEGEFVNPFCRLSYAPKQAPVAANITNHKAYFAQAVLVRGPANVPETLRAVPPEIVSYLQTIQQ